MIKTRGNLQVQTLPKLTASQLHPEERNEINLNTCGGPDCGNFGVRPDPVHDQLIGRGAVARRQAAGQKDPKIAAGLGFYTMSSVKDEERISTALNFHDASAVWSDGRRLVCRHLRGRPSAKSVLSSTPTSIFWMKSSGSGTTTVSSMVPDAGPAEHDISTHRRSLL